MACGHVSAQEWKLYRFEGRDYVSLENVATFYGLPAPPPLAPNANPAAVQGPPLPPAIAAPPPAPVPGPSPSASSDTKTVGMDEPSADSVAPSAEASGAKVITLDNGKYQLAITPNSREARINGVTQWLAFPASVQEGKVLISRLDLSKTIEPRLRPEKMPGLKPVTTVVLDPGHGGHDHGAICKFGFEKDFALDVAMRARDLLEKKGFRVIMTRSADIFIPLHERPAAANHVADSIFVSIHFNAATSNSSARGFEIYSCAPRGAPATNDGAFTARDLREEPGNTDDNSNTLLSGSIFHSLLGHVPLPDRGIKHARFAVLRLCTQPAVLIEGGFVTNSADSALIASAAWRAEVAQSIVTGIENYKELAEQHVAPKLMADYRRSESGTENVP